MYELVAYKRGFEPALQRLWHQAGTEQVSAVSIKLTKKGGAAAPETPVPVTIWELRDRLPTDVLRELAIEEVADKSTPARREGAPFAPARGRAEDHDGSGRRAPRPRSRAPRWA